MSDRCSDCRWFDNTAPRPPSGFYAIGDDDAPGGLCRFSAPVVAGNLYLPPWPFCKATDWCGRFSAREG